MSDSKTSRAPFQPDWPCLIVLPTFNERDNLERLIQAVSVHVVADVLIVDDNSPDGTGDLADDLAHRLPHVHVVHRQGKLGLGTACSRWTVISATTPKNSQV